MRFEQGEVVLVLFPDSNLRTAKRRPALVVMADGLNTGLPQTIVAMITSNMARTGHPSRIKVDKSSAAAAPWDFHRTNTCDTIFHHAQAAFC